MQRARILIVEDDTDIQQLVSFYLIKSGFSALCADTGEQALEIIREEEVDCVLLDLMLPGIDGMEVCRTIRAMEGRTAKIPVIMLTARGEDEDIITGLEAGADDYVSKPFSPKVLISRIKAVLRRLETSPLHDNARVAGSSDVLEYGSIVMDLAAHRVTHKGRELSLTFTEFSILALLMERPGTVYSRDQIIEAVRGYGYSVTSRAVDVQIHGIRRKLGEDSKLIETVRGLGYRIAA